MHQIKNIFISKQHFSQLFQQFRMFCRLRRSACAVKLTPPLPPSPRGLVFPASVSNQPCRRAEEPAARSVGLELWFQSAGSGVSHRRPSDLLSNKQHVSGHPSVQITACQRRRPRPPWRTADGGRAAISRRAPPFPVTFFFYSPFLLLLRNLVAKDTDRAQVVAVELLPFFCLVLKRTRQMANWWSWMLLVLVGAVIAMLTEWFASSCFILPSSWFVSQHAADLKGNSLYASLLAEFITNRPQKMIPLFIYSMITLLPPTKPCTANTALLFWLAVWWTIEV